MPTTGFLGDLGIDGPHRQAIYRKVGDITWTQHLYFDRIVLRDRDPRSLDVEAESYKYWDIAASLPPLVIGNLPIR
jgi:hypothetical protein